MKTRFVAEAHIPHGSGDAEYLIIEVTTGAVVALVDPHMLLDDPLKVAEKMADLLNIEPETIL